MKSLNVISGSGEIFPVLIPENGMTGKLRYAVELMNSGSSDSGISLITAALEPLFPRNYRTALRRITAADAFKLGSALAELFALSGTGTAAELSLEVPGTLLFREESVPLKPAVSGDIVPGTVDFFYNGSLQITDESLFSGTEDVFLPNPDPAANSDREGEFFPVADPGYIQPGLPFSAAETHTEDPGESQHVNAEKAVWEIPGAISTAKKTISIFSDAEQWNCDNTFSLADISGSVYTGAIEIPFCGPECTSQNFVCGTDTACQQRFEYSGEKSGNFQSPCRIMLLPEKKDEVLHTDAVIPAYSEPAEKDTGVLFEPSPAEKFHVKNIQSSAEVSDGIIKVAFAFKWTLEYTASLPEDLLKRCMAHAGIKCSSGRTELPAREPSPEEISRAVQRGRAALEKVLEKLKKD